MTTCPRTATIASMLCLPMADSKVLARRNEIVAALRRLVAPDAVVAVELRLAAYETDAFTAYRQRPLAVVPPRTTAEVASVTRVRHPGGLALLPRGAGR